MYSERIINQRLTDFAERESWMPVYHSLAEVEQFKEMMARDVKLDSNTKNTYIKSVAPMTEQRRKDIRRWIENEQVLCGLDSNYWETRYAWVCDEKGQIYKFKPRLSQQIYNSVIADFDDKQVSIELLILKGRQLGITTQTAMKFLHRMLFLPHTQAIMASVKSEASQLISRIIDTAYERCPFWLVPVKGAKRTYSNGSVLSIQSGMQATGLAQGWTPSLVHLSEIADIPDPFKTIEEGLFRAAHSSKNLFMVLEGTGGGNTGWLADTWRDNKAKWPLGTAKLFPMFIPWPMCPEIYPQVDWIRKYPVPGGFMSTRKEATKKHVARCESYVRNTPYLSRVAGLHWKMPVEQQWFWQFHYDQACGNHTQKTWMAQMPADDFESLTGKHDPVFDPEVVQEVEEHVYEIWTNPATGQDIKTRKTPVQAYVIQGDSVDEAFIISDSDPRIDWDKPVIQVNWKNNRGQKYHWEMIPLLSVNEEIEVETLDLLMVYEHPRAGYDYSCGVDTADGLGMPDEERACVSMCRNQFGNAYDYQVAELTSVRMNPAQLTAFAACMAAWYSERTKDWRGVKFAIEQVKGPGDTCQNQLKIMGFNYHHKPARYDGAKVKDVNRHREGWYSNSVSVPILMTRFVEAVNGGWFRPHSKWLIEEIRNLERHITSGKSKMEHREGQFDDRVRAAAQAYFTTHDLDDLAERSQKRYAQPEKKRVSPEEGRCKANAVSIGDW